MEQKAEIDAVFDGRASAWKSLDYVTAWFMKAADYGTQTDSAAAFVSTNSICQGEQVPILWPLIFQTGHFITFAHTSFKWANLASHNAGVTVAIIGISKRPPSIRRLYSIADDGVVAVKESSYINAYLVPGPNVIVHSMPLPPADKAQMDWGNKPSDGGNLILSAAEAAEAVVHEPYLSKFVFDFVGSQEFIRGIVRRCLWIEDDQVDEAKRSEFVARRLAAVRLMRLDSAAASTREYAERSHRFRQIQGRSARHSVVIPKVTSESRHYLPVGVLSYYSIVSDNAFALYDAPLWNMALIASRMHLVWVGTVCGKLETRYRYSNTLGWNTFPVPTLTDENKAELTRCAEDILLAREAHFPATIAEMYDPEAMDRKYPDLRAAHDRNDETLERIYIGRRFRNDTERLEKLFELYTQMTARQSTSKETSSGAHKPARRKTRGAGA